MHKVLTPNTGVLFKCLRRHFKSLPESVKDSRELSFAIYLLQAVGTSQTTQLKIPDLALETLCILMRIFHLTCLITVLKHFYLLWYGNLKMNTHMIFLIWFITMYLPLKKFNAFPVGRFNALFCVMVACRELNKHNTKAIETMTSAHPGKFTTKDFKLFKNYYYIIYISLVSY